MWKFVLFLKSKKMRIQRRAFFFLTGSLTTLSVYCILQNFHNFWHPKLGELVVASHTAMYLLNLWHHDSFLHILLSRTMCKITTVSPSVFIFHSHTSSFRVNHSVFWFSKAFESKLRGSRRKKPSPVPVRMTNRWKARTKNNFGVSSPRSHIERQENHPSDCCHKASERW